jgi:hypothetical protein
LKAAARKIIIWDYGKGGFACVKETREEIVKKGRIGGATFWQLLWVGGDAGMDR